MSSSISLEKVFSDDVCTVHRGRALVVLVWHTQPTVLGIGPLIRALLTAVKGNASGTLICALIDTEMPMPDAATREALQAGIKRIGVMRGAVNIIAGTGFRAAAIRGMLTGFSMMLRERYPVSFVATEGDAASFLVKHWPEEDSPTPSRSDLERSITAVKPTFAGLKSA